MSYLHDAIVRDLKPSTYSDVISNTPSHVFDMCELIVYRYRDLIQDKSKSQAADEIAGFIREIASQWDESREDLS